MRSGGRRTTPTAREPESAQAAYTEAVKRLARQPQSRSALRQRLVRLGYAEAAVDAALDRAQGDGYLNDQEYAATLVRRRSRGRGHALIAQELRAKGIEESTAGPALAAVEATLVEKSGSWFSCNGQRMGQGREQTVGFLKANPKLGEELIAQMKGKAAEKILQPA